MAVAPPTLSYYSDSLFPHLQGPTLPSLSSGPMIMTDNGSVALGPSVAMAAQSLFSCGDNGAFSAWDLYSPYAPSSYFNLPNAMQSGVESLDPDDDILLLGNDADFLQQMNGCTSVTMHPNLVSTLKTMVAPASPTHPALKPSHPLFDEKLEVVGIGHGGYYSQSTDHHSPQWHSPVEVMHATKIENCMQQPADTIKQESEKSETEDNIEAAVVSVDLIQNRRPFRCAHSGCNKTFKNPQTMKMHHKTHYAEGGGGSRAGLLTLPTLSSSLKAGHNKKIPSRCPKCKKTFVGLYELRRHYGRKHSEGEKGFGCRKCGKKFYIEVDVRDHEKLCGEPIECKCGLKFAFKCNLVAHKKAHPTCQDNHSTSSDDSDQTHGNSPTVSQATVRSSHGYKGHEVVSPQTQVTVPIMEFPGLKPSQYDISGMHFPASTEQSSGWPPSMQYSICSPKPPSFSTFAGCTSYNFPSSRGSGQQMSRKHPVPDSMLEAFVGESASVTAPMGVTYPSAFSNLVQRQYIL